MKESIVKAEINKLVVKSWRDLVYIPILSEDPVLAANSLTLKDEQEAIKLIIDTYKNIGTEEQKNKALERTILFSKFNFEWFVSFLTELCRLNEEELPVIPYQATERIKKGEELFIFPPLKFSRGVPINEIKNKKYVDPLIQHRVKYISEMHEAEEFRDGFPSWYVLSNTTIYERYSIKTGVRARIDFQNGEFHYFIAGASDNWKQIVGVPLEMDNIVANLLFKD